LRFTFAHNNLNVLDLEKSLRFYQDALGLSEVRRINGPEGKFVIVYLGDGASAHRLELTWMKDRVEPYNLGDNEIHLALTTDEFDEALRRHRAMGCVCFENAEMGIYFIADPDGYWTEILPVRH